MCVRAKLTGLKEMGNGVRLFFKSDGVVQRAANWNYSNEVNDLRFCFQLHLEM